MVQLILKEIKEEPKVNLFWVLMKCDTDLPWIESHDLRFQDINWLWIDEQEVYMSNYGYHMLTKVWSFSMNLCKHSLVLPWFNLIWLFDLYMYLLIKDGSSWFVQSKDLFLHYARNQVIRLLSLFIKWFCVCRDTWLPFFVLFDSTSYIFL